MPLYKYTAVTKTGQRVENRVEAANKYELIKKLKKNKLLPIETTQINSKSANKKKKQKKNLETSNSVLNSIRKAEIQRSFSAKKSFFEKTKRLLNKNEKITKRDVAIFTENLYLLKKANFNNIHALTTIRNTTEELKIILLK